MSAGGPPDVYYTRTFTKTLSAWGADTLGLGGWMLSSMHVYDPTSGILYQGDGAQRRSFGGRVLRLIAGNGTQTSAPTDTPAVNSGFPGPPLAAVSSNGDVYLLVSEASSRVLRKVVAATGKIVDVKTLPSYAPRSGTTMAFSPDQRFLYIPTFTRIMQFDTQTTDVTVFAGSGTDSHVDGPASAATFGDIRGVAVGPDGSVYAADGTMVRKISPDQARTVTTVAGSSSATLFCSNGNGKPAKQLHLNGLSDFGVAVAPDGILWIGSGYDLIQVDGAGLAWCHTMSDGWTHTGEVNSAVAVSADNSVYFARNDWQRPEAPFAYSLRTLNADSKSLVVPDSETTIVAGGRGVDGEPTDGAPATSTPIATVPWMAAGPDGSLYFINRDAWHTGSTRVYQLTPPPKTNLPNCAIALPSEDGSRRFCFDKDGRHLSTRNARTGDTLLAFTYTAGLLTDVYDPVNNNHTSISRTPSQVTITGAFGQTTKIELDPTTNYATRIVDATNRSTSVTHDSSGLLLAMTDRNGKQHSFAYDSLGRLKKDSDPEGFQILQRTATVDGVPIGTPPVSWTFLEA